MLVRENLDESIIDTVMQRVGSNSAEVNSNEPIDENAIMFESTLAQFDAIPQREKTSMHRRRDGLKRIDDEHLINLEKRSAAEEKRLQEEA